MLWLIQPRVRACGIVASCTPHGFPRHRSWSNLVVAMDERDKLQRWRSMGSFVKVSALASCELYLKDVSRHRFLSSVTYSE